MATASIINVKKIAKDLTAINKRIAIIEGVAETRTLNIIAARAKTMIANDVNEDTGISKGTARRRIKIDKATRNRPNARLFISAERVTYPSPRKLKGGVSFIGAGKQRKRVYGKQDGGKGSRPFVIKGQHSSKKLPVYVSGPYTQFKTAKARRVTAMYFSSLAYVARRDWQEKVNDFSIREIKKELPIQLGKARHRGRF